MAFGGASPARVGELLERFGSATSRASSRRGCRGGERQRVAVARALGRDPAVLLLDEPLSALDAHTRTAVREELADILAGLQIPTLIVTHDFLDASTLADRIGVILDGRLHQIGPPGGAHGAPRGRVRGQPHRRQPAARHRGRHARDARRRHRDPDRRARARAASASPSTRGRSRSRDRPGRRQRDRRHRRLASRPTAAAPACASGRWWPRSQRRRRARGDGVRVLRARQRPRDHVQPGDWAVLALVAEGPTHGFAIARALAPGSDVGRVWAMRRPLVYRALDVLTEQELVRAAGTEGEHRPGRGARCSRRRPKAGCGSRHG